MTSEQEHDRSNKEYDELVAYLDGELDQTACDVIESRLASDTQYLQQLKHLQKTWDLLDTLPHPQVTESFTKSTLEMLVVKETKAIRKKSTKWWTWPLRISTAAAIGGVAGLAGFSLMQSIQDAPNRQLIRDLGVIENVDIYRSLDSVEFLGALDEAELFMQEEPSEP